MKEELGTVVRVATPMRSLAQRFAFLILFSGAIALLIIERTDPRIFEQARMGVIDAATPVLDVISRPVASASDLIQEVRELTSLRATNVALKAENDRLLRWQHAARTLLVENGQLRELLNFVDDTATHSVTGRVIGDSGGPFVRSLLVNAGTRIGVDRGHAAVSGEGLLGRVAFAGETASRVLLLSDLNSRIPVLVEDTRARAVLAGDNNRRPRLAFVSADARVKVGSRIVTSGLGGMFPTGLPIGIVSEIGDAGIRIETFASPERLEFIRLVDYGLKGVISLTDGEITRGVDRKR